VRARLRPPRRAAGAARLLRACAALVAAALALGVGCELAGPRPRSADAVAPSRVITLRADVTAHVAAEPALAPVRVVASGRRALVLDAAHRRLAEWTSTRDGVRHVGPTLGAASRQVVALADTVAVLDPQAARLVQLAADVAVRRVELPRVPGLAAACPFGDGSWLLLTDHATDALLRVAADGQVRWRRPLPWAPVSRWPALARQGLVVPARGGCVLAMAFGPGWATVDTAGRYTTVMPYRETMPVPRRRRLRGGEGLTARAPLVGDASLRGDTLELLVGGATAAAWRTLDRYHVRTGGYLGSVALPGPVRAITAVPGGWIAIVPTPGGPRLARLAPADGGRVGNAGRSR
jgi:hypothetical protein